MVLRIELCVGAAPSRCFAYLSLPSRRFQATITVLSLPSRLFGATITVFCLPSRHFLTPSRCFAGPAISAFFRRPSQPICAITAFLVDIYIYIYIYIYIILSYVYIYIYTYVYIYIYIMYIIYHDSYIYIYIYIYIVDIHIICFRGLPSRHISRFCAITAQAGALKAS